MTISYRRGSLGFSIQQPGSQVDTIGESIRQLHDLYRISRTAQQRAVARNALLPLLKSKGFSDAEIESEYPDPFAPLRPRHDIDYSTITTFIGKMMMGWHPALDSVPQAFSRELLDRQEAIDYLMSVPTSDPGTPVDYSDEDEPVPDEEEDDAT